MSDNYTDPPAAACLAFLAFSAPGCGSSRRPWIAPSSAAAVETKQPQPDARTRVDASGVLADRGDEIQRRWIPEGTRGLPPGWIAVDAGPDPYWSAENMTLVHGLTRFHERVVEVARTPRDRLGRAYAALSHELAHAWVWEATHDDDLASRAGHLP